MAKKISTLIPGQKETGKPVPKSKRKTKLSEAVKVVTAALKKDPGYRLSWSANIAMAFKDNVVLYKRESGKKSLSTEDYHIIANKAAEHFLQSLCGEIKYPKGR